MGRGYISTHALREEGDPPIISRMTVDGISTHALREEGDPSWDKISPILEVFLPTPSARRATIVRPGMIYSDGISTHALREEGDRLFLQSRA